MPDLSLAPFQQNDFSCPFQLHTKVSCASLHKITESWQYRGMSHYLNSGCHPQKKILRAETHKCCQHAHGLFMDGIGYEWKGVLNSMYWENGY